MNADYYKQYEPVFNSWYLKKMLGEGSYGKVFEIEREDFGTLYKAALKTMTIPQSESEIKSVMADGMDEASVREYYENFVEDIVKEFVLMSKLKGNSNIVSYEDHMVIEHKDKIGWDILIRMELLTPLHDYIKTIDLTRKDVIQLGIDMCKALELCQKYNIIHRDIKPENIFVSENGDYKLGDFGIARTLEQTSGMLSKKGTQAYMAPEIYREESYGSNVDIYSLGIVMYRLLNENRTPFLPAYPAPITHNDREAAIKKRISGAPLPKPTNADGRLAEIVLKACSYNPKERYFSPMEMREELEAILYNKEEAKIIYPKGDETPIKSIQYIKTGDELSQVGTANRTEGEFDDGRNSKTNGTEGRLDRKPSDEFTSGTEGAFGGKHDRTDKTESDFESKIIDDEKTEGMFGKTATQTTPQKAATKKSVWRNWRVYAAGGVVIAGMCVGGFFLLNHHSAEYVSYSVASVAELSEPIEVKISEEAIPEADYDIIVKRLEAFAANYYIDRENGIMVLNKYDLGMTNREILATVNMITGVGNLKIAPASGTDSAFTNDDFSMALYSENERDGYTELRLIPTTDGYEKVNNIKNLLETSAEKLCLYVDENIRSESGEVDTNSQGICFWGQYDGKGYRLQSTYKAYASETDDSFRLSAGYARIVVVMIECGKLSHEYKAVIDEKYGITIEQVPEATESLTDEIELPIEEETEVPNITESPKSSNNTGYTKPRTKSNNSDVKPKETEPVQVQTTPQPQQQVPVEQPTPQPVEFQQQPSSGSSNANNLPEFYMDFE